VTGRTAIRFVKPTAERWGKALRKALIWTYLLSIPLSVYWIQLSGMGVKADMHLSVGKVLAGVAMECLLWAPLTCVWLSPFLLPLAGFVAFVSAGVRRVPVSD
jgi:hypothetical protein